MFTLHLRIPHRPGDTRDLTATARDNEPSVRRFLDSIGVHPIAAIRYARNDNGLLATCTVLAYPERSAA